MLLTTPYEELEARRLPWATWGLCAVWIATFLAWRVGGVPVVDAVGLVPAEPRPQAVAAHWLLHASGAHLAASLLLLLLVGPALEALWGRVFFLAFFVACALLTSGAYVLAAGDSPRPFVGASGALAASMAAFALRFLEPGVWYTAVGWWRGVAHVRFWVPAYAIAAVWFGCEVAMQLAGSAEGATRGVTYAGQIAGLVLGLGVLVALQRLGLEERWLGILPEGAPHPALAAAREMLELRGPAAAVSLLEDAARRAPHDPDLVRMLCEQAVAAGEPARAAPAFEGFARARLREGDGAVVAGLWGEYASRVGRPGLEARLAMRLAEALRGCGERIECARTLRSAIRAPGFTPGMALRVVELARGIHNGVALEAASVALDAPHLHEAKRARLENVVAELEIAGEHADDPELDAAEARPGVVDRSIAIEPEDDLRRPPPEVASAPAVRWELDPDESDTQPDLAAGEEIGEVDADPVPGAAPAAPPPIGLSADGTKVAADDDADLAGPLAGELPDTDPILPDLGPPGAPADDARGSSSGILPPSGLAPERPSVTGLAPVGTSSGPAGPDRGPEAARRVLPPSGLDLAAAPDPGLEAAAALPRFGDAKRLDAVPLALDGGRIQLRQGSKAPAWLPLSRVEAVAAGAVGGLAARPVVIIDLLLNWSALDDVPLRVVRLRSDRFDPLALCPGATPGLEAFRALLETLLDETGGVPLPDLEGARGLPFRRFDDLAAYEREVLQIDV